MTSTSNNLDQNVPQIVEKAVANAIAPLLEKIAHLETSHSELIEKIIRLEISQAENLNDSKANFMSFLKQLADTLNSKKSSNLEPTLQELTKALQMVGFQVQEQRHTQEQLIEKIQQLLTAQQVMEVLDGKTQMLNNESQDLP